MANIFGSPGDDQLVGTPNSDNMYGDAGNDQLSGAEDADYLFGGEGNDTLYGDAGDDYLEGEAGSDALYGGAGADYLYGGSGADFLSGGDDNDDLSGGDGNDTLLGDAGDDNLQGDSGADVLYGGAGENYLTGGDGIDTALFAGLRGNYALGYIQIGALHQWDFTSAFSFDHLVDVERLVFSDADVALDLASSAGFTAKLIGALLGPQFIVNADYVGIGLHYLDQGVTHDVFVQAVIDARLGVGASNAAFVDLVYTNLARQAPTQDEAAPFVQMLDRGQLTQVQLAELAMESSFNTTNIGFAGLVGTGIAFTPY